MLLIDRTNFPSGTYAYKAASTTGLPPFMPHDDIKAVRLMYARGFHRQADRLVRCYENELPRLDGRIKPRWCYLRWCTQCSERLGKEWSDEVAHRIKRMTRPETAVLTAPVAAFDTADHVFAGVDGLDKRAAREWQEAAGISRAVDAIGVALRRLQQNKRLAGTRAFAVIEISNSVGPMPFPHVHIVMDALTDYRDTIIDTWQRCVPNGRLRVEPRAAVKEADNLAAYLTKPLTASVDVYRLHPAHFEGLFRAVEDRPLFRSIAVDK